MSEWIEVKKGGQLPDKWRDVLVSIDGEVIPASRGEEYWFEYYGQEIDTPDAWMPFPNPFLKHDEK